MIDHSGSLNVNKTLPKSWKVRYIFYTTGPRSLMKFLKKHDIEYDEIKSNLEDESVKIDFMAGDNKVVFTFLHPEEVYSKADVFDRVHGAVEAVQKKLHLAYNTDIVVKSKLWTSTSLINSICHSN